MEEYEIHNNRFSQKQPYILLHEVIRSNQRINWHESPEILHFKQGTAKITLNNEVIFAHPGDIVFINSNSFHNIISADNKIIKFDCLIVNPAILEQYSLYFTNKTRFSECIASSEVKNYFSEITEAHERGDSLSQADAIANILLLFSHLQKNFLISSESDSSGQISKHKFQIVLKALDFIKNNYLSKISIQDIADYINFNSDYLTHVFKECTGHTLVGYINILRCHHAKSLLTQKHVNVSTAAIESGFSNTSYFTKKYKEIFGELPSAEKK